MSNASRPMTYVIEADDSGKSYGDKMDLDPDLSGSKQETMNYVPRGASKRDREPEWNNYQESVLNDILQQVAATQNMDPEKSGYGEDILEDIVRRLTDPYNFRPAQRRSIDPRMRIRSRRDLE